MTELSALVGSRICHDLISPLGAIGNGMELLAMAADGAPGGPGAEELALINDSVARANARIRLFRLAFGAAAQGVEIAGQELRDILGDCYGGSRLGVVAEPPVALPRPLARTALLAVLCAETALPHGGQIRLAAAGAGMTLSAEGPRLALEPRLWGPILEGRAPDGEISAAEVQFALLPRAARESGRRLSLDHGETTLNLAF